MLFDYFFDCSFAYKGDQIIELVGTKGMIASESLSHQNKKFHVTLKVNDQLTRKAFSKTNNYPKCIADFQQRIIKGNILPSPATDSFANMTVLDAITQAAQQNQTVEL